jgi:hypothetical protein
MKHVTSLLGFWVVSVLCAAIMLVVPARPAQSQTQTPGHITQFDPSLNVVDSVITQDASGNVGIGTTTPAAALDVNTGDLNVAGNFLKGGALFLHNFGFQNTFLGQNAGNLTITGSTNTAMGALALGFNTTGYQNTATGAQTLANNSGGFNNTANGVYALFANTTGAYNTAIGESALFSTNSYSNTAVGAEALFGDTTGGENTAIGTSSLWWNSSGAANTAVGALALHNNTNGFFNTAIGDNTLYNNTTGGSNTAVGAGALSTVAKDGNYNTAIGAQADTLGGESNTAIGAGAAGSVEGLVNATAIGAGAVVNASNKIRLGDTHVSVIEGQVPYTFTSDKNQKESFHSVDGEEVLRKIGHYGPVAQEFFDAFGHDGVGVVGTPTTINSGDLEGILMIAVQALEKRTAENAELKARIETLERVVKGIQTADQR